jgi:uncharacterized protein
MIRALDDVEVERILRAEAIGRIGCHTGKRTYVVPVSYVYEDGAVYAHSTEGRKIEMMRQNPSVCFEVDHVEDLVNWCSAICWGEYEELYGEQAEHGLAVLRTHLQKQLPRRMDHAVRWQPTRRQARARSYSASISARSREGKSGCSGSSCLPHAKSRRRQ